MKASSHFLLGGQRFCYIIPPAAEPHNKDGFIPAIVVEGEDGYHLMAAEGKMPYVWGPSREDAEAACQQQNERLGLTEAAVLNIVCGSLIKARQRT